MTEFPRDLWYGAVLSADQAPTAINRMSTYDNAVAHKQRLRQSVPTLFF
jgi:hypothetical protein